MYLEEVDIEKKVLRQGDILKDVMLLGVLNYGAIFKTVDNMQKTVSWQYNAPPSFGYAVVLSHSCEIERANNGKVTSIILAPLIDVDSASSKDKLNDLKASNAITEKTSFSFLKYFYLHENEKIPFSAGSVIDFSRSFSLKKDCYEELLKKKILQLDQKTTDEIALKYSLYFYRSGAS